MNFICFRVNWKISINSELENMNIEQKMFWSKFLEIQLYTSVSVVFLHDINISYLRLKDVCSKTTCRNFEISYAKFHCIYSAHARYCLKLWISLSIWFDRFWWGQIELERFKRVEVEEGTAKHNAFDVYSE